MNNIQKSFKRKAEANGNCFAAGVVPSDQGGPVAAYTPTGGEAKMLAAFDERMGNALGTSTGGVTDPNAGLRKAGDMRLTQQTYDATNAIEDQRDQLGVAAQTDMTKRAGDQLDSIRRMSGLSNRQRATAAMGVAGDAAKMGVSLDTSGLTSGSGLSARQQLGVSGQQFDNQTAIGGYNNGLQSRSLDRQKMGLAQGLDVNRKKLGMFADGKVPVHSGPGIVEGPGGPREDKVPAMLSDDEAVLPAKTVQALGGPDAVADLIEKTTGKAPAQGLREGGRFADGALPTLYDPVRDPSRAFTPYQAPIEAPRSTTPVQDGVRMGGSPAQTAQAYRPNWVDATRQVAPYQAPVEAPHSPTPVQDGVRMGGTTTADARPNWTDPTRQVAPQPSRPNWTHGQPVDPTVIESTATRVSNTGTSVVPTNGQTQFHDKISAEEVARGNQNRAQAFKAADEAAASAKPAAPAAAPEPAGKMAGLRKWGGRANMVAGAGMGVYDMATGETPADQVVGAVKMLAAAPHPVARAVGNAATYGDMGLRAVTGNGVGHYLDKVAQLHPDYMVEKQNKSAGAAAKPEDQYADARAANAKILASGKNTPGSIDLPRIDKVGAKEAGNQARGLAVAKQFFPDGGMPEDIRVSRQNETNAPMAVWNSKGDAAAKTIGSLKDGSYIQPQDGTGIVSIRQKDGSFKNVALGKSEYLGADGKTTSDFSKTARYQQGLRDAAGQRQQLENFQRMNADSDMKSNDPNAQMNGLMTTMGLRATDAQRAAAAAKNAITPYQQAQLQIQASQEARANRAEATAGARDARDFKAKDDEAHTKRLTDLIENWAGDSKAEGYNQRVAALHAYAGNFKRGDKTSDQHISELIKNKAYDDFVNGRGQHWLTPQKEQTGQPVMPTRQANTGLRSVAEGAFVSKNRFTDANTGQTYYDSDIANMPKELQEIHEQRLAEVQKRRAAQTQK